MAFCLVEQQIFAGYWLLRASPPGPLPRYGCIPVRRARYKPLLYLYLCALKLWASAGLLPKGRADALVTTNR